MALRTIRTSEDEILRKTSKKVKKITPRILELIDDMLETMYEKQGVGLAAVQVGVLRRIVVIDIGKGPIVLINPEIVDKSEEEYLDYEGCLSVPGEQRYTYRPVSVKVRAINTQGEEFEISSDEKFLSKAICHELDHLDGILYTDVSVTPSEEELEVLNEKYEDSSKELKEE